MKIAFLHHVFQAGSGIEQVILELATRLKLMGHDAFVVTYSDEHHYPNSIPVEPFRLPLNNRITRSLLAPAFFGTNRDIRRRLTESDVDVVVTSLYPMSIIPLWPRKISAKEVFIEWGIQPYSAFGSLADKTYLWLLNRADRYAIKRSDKVLVANGVTKEWVERQGVRPVKLHLYGINFDRLDVNAEYEHLYQRHRELADADGVILYAGRQSPHKNIEVLIQAVALSKRRGRNVKLLIVGRESFPKYASQLRTLTRELDLTDDVTFTGLVSEEDLAGYYNLCDIFVNASWWEGFLNPEAYAFKKPIVAYGVPPHDETVQDGVTGLLVNEPTPNRFAWAIQHLLTFPETRLAMGEAGYQWAKENLDYGIVARNFIEEISR